MKKICGPGDEVHKEDHLLLFVPIVDIKLHFWRKKKVSFNLNIIIN